jgi:hypothetical protein
MSNLNPNQFRLFHGTTNQRIRGGVIQPRKQRGPEWEGDGPEAAFASSKLEDAASYGHNVYEVHPSDRMDHYGNGVVASEEGFKVKRKMNPEVVDRYSRIFGPIRSAQEDLAHRKWMGERGHEEWHSEGPGKEYHVTYDKEGNQTKTLLKPGQLRPGDPVKE